MQAVPCWLGTYPASQKQPVWLLPQVEFDGHVPQVPPHPSGPQVFPLHCGTHTHWPPFEHASLASHDPHVPPQPSGPQLFPSHCGTHAHRPFEHVWSAPHDPHVPPQPSGPQLFPSHWGAHAH